MNILGIILMVVGGLWAFMGLGNLVLTPWADGNVTVNTIGIIINGVVFLLPGLMLTAIGALLRHRRQHQESD